MGSEYREGGGTRNHYFIGCHGPGDAGSRDRFGDLCVLRKRFGGYRLVETPCNDGQAPPQIHGSKNYPARTLADLGTKLVAPVLVNNLHLGQDLREAKRNQRESQRERACPRRQAGSKPVRPNERLCSITSIQRGDTVRLSPAQPGSARLSPAQPGIRDDLKPSVTRKRLPGSSTLLPIVVYVVRSPSMAFGSEPGA